MENKRRGVGMSGSSGGISLKKIYTSLLSVIVGATLYVHISILNDSWFTSYLDSLLIDPS